MVGQADGQEMGNGTRAKIGPVRVDRKAVLANFTLGGGTTEFRWVSGKRNKSWRRKCLAGSRCADGVLPDRRSWDDDLLDVVGFFNPHHAFSHWNATLQTCQELESHSAAFDPRRSILLTM